MLFPVHTPLAVPLPGDFTLRTPSTPDDLPRLALLMGEVFGAHVDRWARRMFPGYPDLEPADIFFVENLHGEVVSLLTLIPWTLRYGPITLPVGELGIAGTRADYRNRGLVAAQIKYFKQRLAQRGCLLSIIQGLEFYYRQFDYDYAWPLEGGWRLELRQAPEEVETGYALRNATPDDIPALARLYDDATRHLTVTSLRTEAIWRYLLAPTAETDADTHRTLVVCDGAGAIAAYVRLPDFHFGAELVVDEASRCTRDAARTVFAHLRREAEAANQPFIRLKLPADHDLLQLARAWGGVDQGTYAWQLHVPDLAALLRGLAPALDERLAASLFARYTETVTLGFYRDALTLRFVDGQLVEVSDLHAVGRADASMPPAAAMPLVLGHLALHELRRAYPDVNVRGEMELLLDTLFPPAKVYLFQVY